jgi:circadian clock protein KaiC
VRGATEFDEPGVCLSFEETAEELAANVASIGFDLPNLVRRKKLAIDHIFTERSLMEETGDYDLEGIFLRLGLAVDSVKAKRVLIDSVEALFAGFDNEAILRAELRRLFRWLKERDLTAIITAERGENGLTRYGIEEYVSDCVILLDNRVAEAVSTRRLRIVKYRGSTHGMNEYPFLIDENGISVLPITSLGLNQEALIERVSTGIAEFDAMLGGDGYYRGSSVLVSGTAGTGKTSLAAHFVDAACARGERCAFFSFEESSSQIIRNMRSIGIDLKRWVDKGLLQFHSSRPSTLGLEMHLVKMHNVVSEFRPSHVVVDPVTALLHAGADAETRSMLLRLVDFLKSSHITALMTTLTNPASAIEQTEVEVSSVVDTWILLRDIESGGERNRGIYVLKARGLAHSNAIREYVIGAGGLTIRDAYRGNGLLTGSARLSHEAREASAAKLRDEEIRKNRALLLSKSNLLEAQIAALQLELQSQGQEMQDLLSLEQQGPVQGFPDPKTTRGGTLESDGSNRTKAKKKGGDRK